MNMTVAAYDNHGNEFDVDQYSKMKFEMQHVVTCSRLLLSGRDASRKRATGLEHGDVVADSEHG